MRHFGFSQIKNDCMLAGSLPIVSAAAAVVNNVDEVRLNTDVVNRAKTGRNQAKLNNVIAKRVANEFCE